MATVTVNTLQPSNTAAADFRAWAQFTHDALVTTSGWVNTSDTGQVDLTTVGAPGALNTKNGYKIYRMADALQATSPVFLRIDYGSAAATGTPGMWTTIGTGSNGSGTITGILYNGGASATPNFGCGTNATGLTLNSYASGDTNRFHLALFVSSTASRILSISIERSKDASGADTGTALLLYGNPPSISAYQVSRYIIMAGGSQPADEAGIQYILSSQNPSTFNSNVGVGLIIPIAGYAMQPGVGCCLVKTSDFTAEATFTCSIYGATRTFQNMSAMGATSAHNGSAGANVRACIRYD